MKRLKKDALKAREEYFKNIKDKGWDEPIEYSDFDEFLQEEINQMKQEVKEKEQTQEN